MSEDNVYDVYAVAKSKEVSPRLMGPLPLASEGRDCIGATLRGLSNSVDDFKIAEDPRPLRHKLWWQLSGLEARLRNCYFQESSVDEKQQV